MRKAPDAFRTISEASDALQTPAHVLRFWESKFPQIKPVKRAGGRRYYRPADISLLSGIKTLLHDQGMTIRGVQKLLVEKGARHVAQLAVTPALTEDILDIQKETVTQQPAPNTDVDQPISDNEALPQPEAAQREEASATTVAPEPEEAEVADHTPVEAEAEAEENQPSPSPSTAQADSVAKAPVLPFPVPAAPSTAPVPEAGPKNAFANLGRTKPRATARPAELAQQIRAHPPSSERLRQAAPLLTRLEALLDRMGKAN